MARPYDWSPLGLDSDPVPGDIIGIRIGSHTLKTVADAITNQAASLRKLSTTEGWDSDSGVEFHTNAGKLADAIEKAHGRYQGVSDALSAYADDLYQLQTKADGLLEDARDAMSEQKSAEAVDLPPKDDPGYDDAKKDYDKAVDGASGKLQAIRDKMQALIGTEYFSGRRQVTSGADGELTWVRANNAAVSAIKKAIDDDLKDAWYEGFRDLIHGMKAWLDTIKDILAIIGTLLAIAILVLSLIIPGANIISALLLAALLVSVLNFIIVGAQAIAGDATTTDVFLAAVDVALCAVGVKAPGGSGKSIAELATGHFSERLLGKISTQFAMATRPLGQRVAGYNSFRSSVLAVTDSGIIKAIDDVVGGGFAKLTMITLNGGTAALKNEMFLKALPINVASMIATTYGTKKLVFDDIPGLGQIVDMVSDPGAYWDEKSKVSVGSI